MVATSNPRRTDSKSWRCFVIFFSFYIKRVLFLLLTGLPDERHFDRRFVKKRKEKEERSSYAFVFEKEERKEEIGGSLGVCSFDWRGELWYEVKKLSDIFKRAYSRSAVSFGLISVSILSFQLLQTLPSRVICKSKTTVCIQLWMYYVPETEAPDDVRVSNL